jgi:hypothetical protein
MSENYAWVCDMLDFAYTPMSMDRPEEVDEKSPTAIASQKHNAGEQYDENAFEPIAKWKKNMHGGSKVLPHVFKCNAFTVVSAKAQEVFRGHDMGTATFRRLRLYEADGVTLHSDQLYLLNFGDRKEALKVEESPNLRQAFSRGDVKKLRFLEQRADDDAILSEAALSGPDLWTDPLLFGGVFFSDQLHNAMRKARIEKQFNLSRCLIKD